MKKQIIGILLLILLLSIVLILIFNRHDKFYLEDKYYENSNIEDINQETYLSLVDKKESFLLFIYQPACNTSFEFEKIVEEYQENYQIMIYKISFGEIKDSKLGEQVKFYPSFVIYKKGRVIDYLESDKKEDLKYYKSFNEFENWINQYVKMKQIKNTDFQTDSDFKKEEIQIPEKTIVEDIKREEKKVNIYFFWGDGCPHCKSEMEFFEQIKDKYGDYYNLYAFETWYHEENLELLQIFAQAFNQKVTGVPFTIIGNKYFIGFNEDYPEKFIEAIELANMENYDIYFDKIITDLKV